MSGLLPDPSFTSDSLTAAVFDVPSVMLARVTLTLVVASDAAVLQKTCPRYIFDIDMMPVSGGRLPVFGGSPGSSTFRGCPVFAT